MCILKVNDENSRIRTPGSTIQWHGSADPDPDPHQNVMDPRHWNLETFKVRKINSVFYIRLLGIFGHIYVQKVTFFYVTVRGRPS